MEFEGLNIPSIPDSDYIVNVTCDYDYVPPASEYFESLGAFGISFVSVGTILMFTTLYLAFDASYMIIFAKESKSFKRNVLLIMAVYPISSLCSLVALSLPRAQLLSEAVTQIFLTIALYRLYLLLIDVGRREVKKSPALKLQVGPCCCWPCLPFPNIQMNPTNLSWIQIIVLQLPIVQTLVYIIFLIMETENPLLVKNYGVFLQPISIVSILLGLYGLSIALKTLQEVNPGSNLTHKAAVIQLVLMFSKLQGFIVKSLPKTGLFPCNPPITPQIYANFTYNALMLIEMLLLCYVARLVYGDNSVADVETPGNNSSGNSEDSTQSVIKTTGTRTDLERFDNPTNNNDNCANVAGQQVQLNIRLAGVTA